jgi:pimeloyl-ACP methyl ester carboxylesterase
MEQVGCECLFSAIHRHGGLTTCETASKPAVTAPRYCVLALLLACPLLALLACRAGPDFAKRIPVGQEQVFIDCQGVRHGPAVIFESGSGGMADDWRLVQPVVARRTQACSYTRPDTGRGGSRDGYLIPTEDDIAHQLHSLLAKASVPPPYVIVGHSYGGMLARRYSIIYPNDVVGMVFVDSAHEEQIWRFRAIAPNSIRGISESDLLRQGFLAPNEHLQWHDDIPLVVIEHGLPVANIPGEPDKNAAIEKEMDALDSDLMSRSRYSTLVRAKHSHHMIPLEEPQVVIQAVNDVLNKIPQ